MSITYLALVKSAKSRTIFNHGLYISQDDCNSSYRWLVLKNRDKEAFAVLTVINGSSKKENILESYFDFEDLKEAKKTVRKNVVRQFLKWKYIRR